MTIEQIKKEHDYYEKLNPDMKNINYTYPDMHIIKAILELNEKIEALSKGVEISIENAINNRCRRCDDFN